MTGSVHKAAAGEIAVIVGGEASVFERHRIALEALGTPHQFYLAVR